LLPFQILLSSSVAHRDPHSFPTRRSSDLAGGRDSSDRGPFHPLHRHADHGGHPPVRGSNSVVLEMAGRLERLGSRIPICGTSLEDRKSTRLNSSHVKISYAVFCLKKKNNY